MSPLTLRRAYLPRNPGKPTAAHPQPAAAAAKAQAQHPQAPHTPENTATLFGPTDRPFRVETFKPGFELETEKELAAIFRRPPRTYKNDPPFYPWLPVTPKVVFQLNFKG